ncbi:hypothetical protein [uncultured Acetobacteroides sp.]|uniref:hypothetical protein n=1 Tax=uncultured Acetobacteroides sp. TaxID=1760811 RepID=UPI0029F4922C|nr:hypothetical protein [uncultured Acetobacteroides sp.]
MKTKLFVLGLCAMAAFASCSKDDDNDSPKTTEPKVVITEDFATATKGTATDAGADLWTATDNFPTATLVYQAAGAVKLGTSSKAGSLETKALDLSANTGKVTVKFKVKGWYANAKLTVSMGDETQSVDVVADKSATTLEEKTVTFTKGTATSKIKFETPMVAKSSTDATLVPVRFFIDDIQVIN